MKTNENDMKAKLRKIISREASRCIGKSGEKLSLERDALKKKYLGYGYGIDDERVKRGYSTYVDRCVMEVIEWAKPSLFRIFTSGDEIIRYDPLRPEQERAAQDATAFVNTVVFGRGMFSLIHDVLTDGLYQRVGWCLAQAPKRTERRVLQYTGLSQQEVEALLSDPALHAEPESVQVESRPDARIPGGSSYDVTLHVTEETRKVELERLPSEQVIVSADAEDVETARFVAFWRIKTASDLKEEGFTENDIADLQQYDAADDAPETITGRTINSEHDTDADEDGMPENRRYQIYEAWFNADINGDGISEKVHATYCGEAEQCRILRYEEWPLYRAPLFAACSVPLPHQVVGLCLADLVADLQDVRTEITRQYLDNLALSNQGELVVSEGQGGSIDFDSLLSRGPGAMLRCSGDATIVPLNVQTSAAEALNGLKQSESMLERRTGVSSRTQALNADALNNTALGASIQEEALTQRIELVARVYAELFFKPLGKYVLHLLCRYQDKPLQMRLRGRFFTIDPRSWDPDMDIACTVGLGTGDRSKMLKAYQAILQVQQTFMQAMGSASPVKLHNIIYTCHRMTEAAGLQAPERFFGTEQDALKAEQVQAKQAATGGNTPEAQKAKAAMMKAQAEVQATQVKTQASVELEKQKAVQKAQLDSAKMAANFRLKQQEMQGEQMLDNTRMQMGLVNDAGSRNLREQQVIG